MGLLGCALLAASLLLAGAEPVEDFAARVDRAVVTGDARALEALHDELLAALERTGAPARLRYDAAYVCWRLSHEMARTDEKRQKRLLKEAESHLDAFLEAMPEHAEALALRGSVIGNRITGMFSGMFLGPRAGKSLRRAQNAAPDNPRVATLAGASQRFTPTMFGGGLDKAEETLRRAVDLFEKQQDEGRAYPHWGQVDAYAWLGIVLANKGSKDEAREWFDQALALEPDHAWIRDALIPKLGQSKPNLP